MRLPLILISVLAISCGIRKADLEKNKSNLSVAQSTFQEAGLKNDINTSVAVSDFAKVWDINTTKDTAADIEINETFDKDGRLTGRTTKAKLNSSEKTSDKGSTTKKDSASVILDKSEKKELERTGFKKDSSEFSKVKKTDADTTVAKNAGGAGWLWLLVVSIAVIAGGYWYLKK